jgi:hypothetical protein
MCPGSDVRGHVERLSRIEYPLVEGDQAVHVLGQEGHVVDAFDKLHGPVTSSASQRAGQDGLPEPADSCLGDGAELAEPPYDARGDGVLGRAAA